MDYPSHETYERLYARYFQGNRTAQLVAMAGPLAGKQVLDLCGGGGRLSAAALAAGAAQVLLVDESGPMASAVPAGVTVRIRPVFAWLQAAPDASVDAAFCQQAVNYWLDAVCAAQLARVLKPGGCFIFNTFNRRPATVPALKHYALEGRSYVEASWLSSGDWVEHVQMCEGEPPHTTRFRWIAPEQFRVLLEPWFELEEFVDGAASVWRCVRKG